MIQSDILLSRLKLFEKYFFPILCGLVILRYVTVFLTYYDEILPAYNDEYVYFLQVKNFYENNNLKSPFSLNGVVSKFGEFGFHGFMYGLTHGLIAKMTGFQPHSIFSTNFVLTLLSFGFIFTIRQFSLSEKCILVVLVGTYTMCFHGCFSYMQEALQVFFAVGIMVVFLNLYPHQDTKLPVKWLILFFSIVILGTLHRILWIFVLPAIWFSYKRKFIWIFITIILTILALLYYQLFYATYSIGFLLEFKKSLDQNLIQSINILITHFRDNFYLFRHTISNSNAWWKINNLTLLLFPLFLFGKYFYTKDKKYIGLFLLINSPIFVIFVLYSANGITGLRVLAFTHYLIAFAVIISRTRLLIYSLLIFRLIYFWEQSEGTVSQLKTYYSKQYQQVQAKNLYQDWNNLTKLSTADKKDEIQVRLPNILLGFFNPNSVVLPVKNKIGQRIFYIVDFDNPKDFYEDYDFRVFYPPERQVDSTQFISLFQINEFVVCKRKAQTISNEN